MCFSAESLKCEIAENAQETDYGKRTAVNWPEYDIAPTVLYNTDVYGQCDKLLTDDCHQFTTLTVHLRLQHLR